MNPFSYSKAKLNRKFTPKQYKRYQTYKRLLRLEFFGKCVYCMMPSSLRGYSSFGVDHYRPKKDFPQLSVAYANLFYCCASCNSNKGQYWPKGALETTHFIPNPCDHIMFAHLKFNGAAIESRTQAGATAKEILDLNDPESVSFREFAMNCVALWEEKRSTLTKKKAKVSALQRKGVLSAEEALQASEEIDHELAKVSAGLSLLSGDVS